MIPLLAGFALAGTPDPKPVNDVLDTLHAAATQANEETYFSLFRPDGVFIGTDATERWTVSEFKAFAKPHFETAPAWAYTPVAREVHFGPKGRVAWFHETVRHARYGDVRGSGVLTREGSDWRITQYVLSFPIPNAVAGDVLDLVKGNTTAE
ncbi:MAG: nuclear transport factor 2 family protein [Myxococcota bacterium]